MIIKRDYYLDQLIAGRGNGLIKVVTGIRRCGKSFILSHLFRTWLLEHGVDADHVIHIPLDDRRNANFRNPDSFLSHIDSLLRDDAIYYIMIDEVQLMDDFVEVLNSMLYMSNVDVYVTGSNSRFLSSDIVTEFRGRSDEIHMYPLSFKEYYSAFGGDRNEAWKVYYSFGGLPQVAMLNAPQKKMGYLENLMSTVFIRDIEERHHVKNGKELEELTKIIASTIGSPTNPTKLVNTFRSLKNFVTTNKTLSKYLGYLEDAFMVEKAVRYNIKGKKYINTLAKYYFSDLGLRNAALEFRQLEETHIMENIIYNELVSRGYSVDVGAVEVREKNKEGRLVRKMLEVDFVANSGNERIYIQSALAMPDEEKKKQETASFRNIDDSFRKVIIVRNDIMRYIDDNGYLIIGLFEFLLNPEAI